MVNESQIPLFFVVRDVGTPHRTDAEKRSVQSHISAKHRRWKKTARVPALHSSTQAILLKKRESAQAATPISASSTGSTPSTRSPTPEGPIEQGVTSAFPVDVIVNSHSSYDRRLPLHYRVSSSHCDRFIRDVASPWKQIDPSERQLLPPFLGDPTYGPFTTTFAHFDPDVHGLLHIYFKIIKPFAQTLINSWVMFENLGQLQQSPALTYAIATYASAFLSGLRKGGPGVVLPPQVEPGQTPLWPVPPWLRLHAKCLAELNKTLAGQNGQYDDTTYQTILFLFRLSVLLSDGPTGRMHLKALRQILLRSEPAEDPLVNELAVSKINIISAYFLKPSVVVRAKTQGSRARHIAVDVDRKHWVDENEWNKFQGSVLGRQLIWRPEPPDSTVIPDTKASITRMDPNSRLLQSATLHQLTLTYQIALFLITYLNNVNFQTSASYIRTNLLALERRLTTMDLASIQPMCPNTVFNVLLSGALASMGFLNRHWFVTRLAHDCRNVRYMNEVLWILGKFTDPWSTRLSLVEGIWSEVLQLREKIEKLPAGSLKLYDDAAKVGPRQIRPCTYSPDIHSPVEVIEVTEESNSS